MDTTQTNGNGKSNGNGAIKVEEAPKAHDDQRIVDEATRVGVATAKACRAMARQGVALDEADIKRQALKAAAKAIWSGITK